jgi:hypothetical protein
MGDRVSIRFTNGEDNDSPVIFSHWGGMDFVESAVRYAQELIAERKGHFEPLDRLEPRTVTCDFLYNLDKYYVVSMEPEHRISHDLYIGLNESDGDNGDNGHFNINLNDVASLVELATDIASNSRNYDGWN